MFRQLMCAVLVACIANTGFAQKQSIRQTMSQAYQYNKELAAERENVKVITENVIESFSEFLPTVTATAQRGREISNRKGSGISKVNDISDSQTLSASLPLFNGLGSLNRYKRERQNVAAAAARLAAIEQEVLLNSVIAYMNVVRERETLLLSKKKEAALQKHYDGTKTRFDLGEITQTDVAQAYTRLTRAVTERIQAEGDFATSQAVYMRIVGADPAGLYLGVDDPFNKEPKIEPLVHEALENNPQIKVAHYNLKAAKYDVHNKRASLSPSVTLEADKSWREGGFLGDGISDIDEQSIMVNVSVPLYQAGAEYSRIRRAKRQRSKVRFDYEEQQNLIREAVIRAVHDYRVSVSSIKTNEANVRTAQTALDGLNHEVQAGVRTTVDLLDAEQELFEAQVLLLRSKRDRIVRAYNILAQLGRLTAKAQELDVPYFDAQQYYDGVKFDLVTF